MKILITILSLFLIGCSRFDGRITKSNTKCFQSFIVDAGGSPISIENTSTSEKFKFIVIRTVSGGSSEGKTTYNETYDLEPGEIKEVGCSTWKMYENQKNPFTAEFKIVGQRKIN